MRKTGTIKSLGISTKVVLSGLTITALFVLTTFAWIIPGAERAILERKREKIKEATETAWSVMLYYQNLAESGALTLEAAQQQAATVIKNMRYGPDMKDYFWINDTKPCMIMHPYRTDLEGKSLTDFRDPNGVALFAEAVKICSREGAGFVSYSWQWKDEETHVVPKISYVRLYRPWQWIVGTGMYIEDVRAEMQTWRIRVIAVSALVALIGIIMSWRIGQAVARRLQLISRNDRDILKGTDRALHLHSIVMLIVVPVLASITIFWCIRFYQSLSNIILDGFNRKLGAISSTVGSFISGEDHQAIAKAGTEDSPLYRQYALPMRRIMEKTGLTYLYTQILSPEEPFCNYVIDASTGEDHSDIGYRDELPSSDYEGGRKVMLYGVIHHGNVEPTEGWGLIKVCYAPIYNSDNTISSMAGADVNISAINEKTRTGLFTVGLLAVCVTLGTGYISILFSRRLKRPIYELRDAALMIAGGNHEHHVEILEPDELIPVSSAFNRIGRRLKDTLSELKTADRNIAGMNIQNDLIMALDRISSTGELVSGTAAAMWSNRISALKTMSGGVTGNQRSIFWLGEPLPPLQAVQRRSELASTMQKLADTRACNCAELIESAARGLVRAVFIAERDGCSVMVFEPVDVLGVCRDGSMKLVNLDTGSTLTQHPFLFIIASDDAAGIQNIAVQAVSNLSAKGGIGTTNLLHEIKEGCAINQSGGQIFTSVMEVKA